MYDAAVVSLCREYLMTWDKAVLPLLADRLEEVGWNGGDLGYPYSHGLRFDSLEALRNYFATAKGSRDVTVPALLRIYGGESCI